MSHSPLTLKNLFGAALVGSTLAVLPAAAQTVTQSDSGPAPIPTCVPANTASGYAMPDTSNFLTVALTGKKPAELCVTPESPPLSAADQAYLEKFSDGLAEAFASRPDTDLPLSKRFKGNFKGKPRRPDIEITSSGNISTSPEGYKSITYLFTVETTDKNHPLVTGQIRLSRPDSRDPGDIPGVKVTPYSVPANDRQIPRLTT